MSIGKKFERLIEIMDTLRGENGCPWDKEQTHESLRQYLLEETYEVLEVIDKGDWQALPGELGDVLFQVVFHARIAQEEGRFDIATVLDTLIKKMIDRHPHVFGDVKIDSARQQESHWEQSKRKEGKKSIVDGVPEHLSALARSYRVQQKAATVGFGADDISYVIDKLHEELDEMKEAIASGDAAHIAEEYGDLLLVASNIGYFLNINPEDALRAGTNKFIRRFKGVEEKFRLNGKKMEHASLEELDAVWDDIKKDEKKAP